MVCPMSDETGAEGPSTQFRYHLELTPAQLKITYTALHSLLNDFGHEEHDVIRVIHEVLDKLPDEHAIRAIQLDREVERKLEEKEPGIGRGGTGPGGDEGPPPVAA
jgi:hypothetical protein